MVAARRMTGHRPAAGPSLLGLEAIVLAVTLMLCWFGASQVPGPAWSVVALANFCWLATLLFRIEPRATILIVPELIGRLSSMISFLFIESGGPIPELGAVGDAGPYASSYLCYTALMLGVFAGAFRLIVGPPGRLRPGPLAGLMDRYANLVGPAIVGLVGLIVLWVLIRGAATGFPLLTGADRYLYRQQMGDKITNYGLNNKAMLLLALGMVAFRIPTVRPVKLLAGATALVYLAVSFLFADKFFIQLNGAASFFAPLLVTNPEMIRRRVGVIALGGALALAPVSAVTWYIYSAGGTMTTAATMDRLSGRLVGQGELWWVQVKAGNPLLTFDQGFVARNLGALRIKDPTLLAVQQGLGPNYFSNLYAPTRIRASGMRHGGVITYTSALEPLGLMAFGWVGLAAALALCGGLLAIFIAYLNYAIVNRSVLSCLLTLFLLSGFRAFLAQGTPWVLIGIGNLKWIVVALGIELVIFVVARTQRLSRPSDFRRTTSRSHLPQGQDSVARIVGR